MLALNSLILILILIFQGLVICKIKKNIEKKSLLFLAGYTFSFIARFVFVIQRIINTQETDPISTMFNIINSTQQITNALTTFITYKFLMDLCEVRIKLESMTLETFNEKMKTQKFHEIVIYSLFFSFQVPIVAIHIVIHVMGNDDSNAIEFYNIMKITGIILQSLFLIMEGYMFLLFVSLIKFYAQKKKEVLSFQNGEPTDLKTRHKFILYIACIIAFFNVANEMAYLGNSIFYYTRDSFTD